ncbi:hypothetical protein ACUTAH_00320 [Metapseudomonas furukawaii]|uniref:hypothetical protein n=1 Tax=Metapseudomonas furukawaii TaxID=1149133 RepID=UPI0040452E37
MKNNGDWLPVIREVHLLGGCRAINYIEPKVSLVPNTTGSKVASFELRGFGQLFYALRDLKLGVVGCDFFTHNDEVFGINPPQWRSINLVFPTWLCTDQGQEWSFISHSAFKNKEAVLCDVASRISHQLRSCEWRLRQLSESYREQLNSEIKGRGFEEGRRFANGYTELCYLSFQSFLVDACILRDYLSEFYWLVTCGGDGGAGKVTTLSGLLRKWKDSPPRDKVGRQLHASAKPGQWMFDLGAYRDLVVHSAPLAKADRTLYAVCQSLAVTGGERLPGIKLPVPNNPSEIKGSRSSGRYFDDPELNFARFSNALENVDDAKDALEYAHLSMQLLGAMAKSVSDISPLRPEMPIITSEDMIGGLEIIEEDAD